MENNPLGGNGISKIKLLIIFSNGYCNYLL